jgi:predicted transcriptional regulator
MKREPAIFENEDESAAADQAAVAEGLTDIEAGRVVSHDAAKRWMLSWGTPDELPPPKVGD